ncbi:hypothetical protein PVT67_14420 [Gallaecimonas kandeliae]|uniref:hypothetical protein n=1 Tax=Gallaecimonas kandeliae TaxID=3029055 RepID=UPI002647933F|nr:hypothetical protein [Gallaecimonas kandeliae]WKE64848.1 hypothetical protein PVT67_14420 [Gallaecimonas kandeliae]
MTLTQTLGTALLLCSAAALAGPGNDNGHSRRSNGGVIYVTDQGLYYDTFAVVDAIPMQGRFQKLNPNGPMGPETEFGPGDPGYLGGRWWVDLNGNGYMDEEDMYFLCPLLGPGRETP